MGDKESVGGCHLQKLSSGIIKERNWITNYIIVWNSGDQTLETRGVEIYEGFSDYDSQNSPDNDGKTEDFKDNFTYFDYPVCYLKYLKGNMLLIKW